MITHSFDNKTEAIIKIETKENAPKVDACIMTFSYVIEQFALEHYPCERIATIWCASGPTPVYRLEYKGRSYAFFKNGVGAPLYVGGMEDVRAEVRTDKFILFENYMRETAHFQTGIQPVNISLVLIFNDHQPSLLAYAFHILTSTLYLQIVL